MQHAAVVICRPQHRKMTADEARLWLVGLVSDVLGALVASESRHWQRQDVSSIFASPVSALRCRQCSGEHPCRHEVARFKTLAETIVSAEPSDTRLNAAGLVLRTSGFKVEADGSTAFSMQLVGDDERRYGDFVSFNNSLIADCCLDDFHSRPQ